MISVDEVMLISSRKATTRLAMPSLGGCPTSFDKARWGNQRETAPGLFLPLFVSKPPRPVWCAAVIGVLVAQ